MNNLLRSPTANTHRIALRVTSYLLIGVLSVLLVALVTVPDIVDPMRFEYLSPAQVLRSDEASSTLNSVLVRMQAGELKWGESPGYTKGDVAWVAVYRRLLTRRFEYRLIELDSLGKAYQPKL